MKIDVEDRHTPGIGAQALCGDRRIVDEAEAARHIGKGMMPRRTAERIGRNFPPASTASAASTALHALQHTLSHVCSAIGQAVSAM
ncbi:hypothetical protein Q644_25365 [Brucella intermedia 229E]|uniref:Uncharacterized protein n=1 Tax=Brucella intermedia 229E TaxID=1337887 RepID=U4V6P8_9HYPH|nr:hypothetical protein Q644_25365 [Brucella intermedia 229E]